MVICINCHKNKPPKEFLKDKHRRIADGLSPWCKECGRDPAILRAVKASRMFNAYYDKPQTAEEVRAAVLKRRIKMELDIFFALTSTRCNRCQEIKILNEFPRSRYGHLRHSRTCTACWALDPDGKVELGRERARDYSRAMATKRPNMTLRDSHDHLLYERYLERRRKDNELQDYRDYGYTRKEWDGLGHERREEIRKAAILAVFAGEVVSERSGAAAVRDVDNETGNETDLAVILRRFHDGEE